MDYDPRANRTLTASSTQGAALELHEITKQFGSAVALDNVSLTVRSGRITALLGENGAGKTTLMRIAFGMIQPNTGWISVNGQGKTQVTV